MRALLIWHSPSLAALYVLVLGALCTTALVHWWFPLLFVGVFAGLTLWSSWLQTRRQRALLHRSRLTYDICRDELRILMPYQRTRFPWQVFGKTVETKEFFLLFISRQRVIFLPKADFERPEEVESVRGVLAQGRDARPQPAG